jgi:hypothetical protein
VKANENKPTIENKRRDTKRQPAHHPSDPYPRHWWNAVFDPQVVIAASAVAALVGGVIYEYVQVREYHADHRPRVVFSRPPEDAGPITCDADKALVHLGQKQQWIQNIAEGPGVSVNPYMGFTKIVPDKKTGIPALDEIPTRFGETACDLKPDIAAIAFPIAAHQELSPRSTQGEMSLWWPKGLLSKDTTFQLFDVECVYYLDPEDWRWYAHHATCTTYRFVADNGPFKCDGAPITGHFEIFLSGHCQN